MNDFRRDSTFETGAVSHPGRVRSHNEDSFVARPDFGLWAVADGMGGHQNGAMASATVAASLSAIGPTTSAADLLEQLEQGVIAANAALRRKISELDGATMGSTLAVLLAHGGHFACVWCGDSRVYLVRAGRITQVSRDHTEAQDMIERGLMTVEEARSWPRRHVITRAIGVHDRPALEIDHGELDHGDVFVLCSDGLTDHVRDEEILQATTIGGAQAICDALLALTLQRGATDNVTVLVVRHERRGAPEKTRWVPNMRQRRSDAP